MSDTKFGADERADERVDESPACLLDLRLYT